jgi:mannose-6-phosphate isomerase-like protein (cupin superfamily)
MATTVIFGDSNSTRGEKAHLRLEEALRRLPGPSGERFAPLFEHGSLLVEVYAPHPSDPQSPHSRDELYVVARGSALFWDGEERRPVSTGDVLFAPARSPHRFEEPTEDFATWVMFYGPEGGETEAGEPR